MKSFSVNLRLPFLAQVLFFSLATSCQTSGTFVDKSAEIRQLEELKNEFVQKQDDVLAPESFVEFSRSLDDAKALNNKQSDATEKVAQTKTLGNAIFQRNQPTRVVLSEVLLARGKVLQAAQITQSAQAVDGSNSMLFTMAEIDEDLKSDTERAFNGNVSPITEKRAVYKNRYTNLEAQIIVDRTIGAEQKKLLTLKQADADSVSPKTFARTQNKLNEAERQIRSDRYNASTLATSRDSAKDEVGRLEKIFKDTKRLKGETAAIELFEKDMSAARLKVANDQVTENLQDQKAMLQSELDETQSDQASTSQALSDSQAALSDVQAESAQMKEFDDKFSQAEQLFLPGEAQVFREGSNLLIRLNGVSFDSGKGELPARSQALLKKLGTVVSDFGPAQVRIEGHTDSSGTAATNARLSTQRANSVRDYLVSQQIVPVNNIVAQGLGESGPLATNKTADGRAQNRRVDVIVQPVKTSR